VEFLPHGRYGKTVSRRTSSRLVWSRAAALAGTAAMLSLALPGGIASAKTTAAAHPVAGTPTSLQAMVAKANQLSNQIDALGQSYDALKIQMTQAKAEAAAARKAAARDEKALGNGQNAVGQIAAQGFMNGSFSPTLQLLQTSDPQQFLNRASIILQIGHEQTGTMNLLQEATDAANRANLTATQEEAVATSLSKQMSKKLGQAQAKENILNSAAYKQALEVFQQTGHYPDINIKGDTLGEQALRFALSKIGTPYVWAAAGPDAFDCSGLVMWAYEQVGIQLEHFTGDQWDEGEHVSRDELQPGDLVFFFNIDHVGLYIGNGLMVDAPSTGQLVQVQPMEWGSYDGAVRIVG
jgi:cell wall-associated NlpC family hydrolase